METIVRSSLVASGNTYNPSLIVLRNKGYDLWLEQADDGSTLWCAGGANKASSLIRDRNCLGLWSSGNIWARTGISRIRISTAS